MREVGETVLDVRGLTKVYGQVEVVASLSFGVNSGEVVALVGANGAGKTTTLRCVVGVETPDAGAVLLDGQPYDESSPQIRRSVCSLLDDWAFFSHLTVREHLTLHAHVHSQPSSVVDDALGALGIMEVADRLPGTLSSGQTRRFALGQALGAPVGSAGAG